MRQKIQTNLNSYRYAVGLWKAIIISFCADAIFILSGEPLILPRELTIFAQPLIVIAMVIAVLILLYPWLKAQIVPSRLRHKVLSKPMMLLFVAFCIAFPIIEILIRLQMNGAIPALIIGAFILFAFISSMKHSLKSFQSRIIPPRNRFLQMGRIDRVQFTIFACGVISARLISLGAALLYLAGIVDEKLFALLGGTSMILLMCLKPTHNRFFGICPTCKHLRSHALDGLTLCPNCSKRSFYEIIKPRRKSSSRNF